MTQKLTKQRKWCNFQISDNVFNRTIDVYIGDRIKTISFINKKYSLKESIESSIIPGIGGVVVLLKTDDENNEYYVVWLEKLVDEYVVHECFHLVFIIMTSLSNTLQESNQESWAYYMGFLVREINKNAKEKGFKHVS